MMFKLGHEVYLYAGETNEAHCTEHISCITEAERAASCKDHYTSAPFDPQLPHWIIFNSNVIKAMVPRLQKEDFLCVIGGICHQMIAAAFPHITCVEFGIGYTGTFAKYRVWESYAWMHLVYGAQAQNHDAYRADGIWFDEVIPGYLEIDRFPFGPREERSDYYMYLGRLIDRKGWKIAEEVCKYLGKRLIIAGVGDEPTYGEFVGVVGPEQRGELLRKAQALFVPSIYIEPFGNVAVEAQACGTPVICTDWGAFTETVVQGMTGYRCRTFQQFIDATEKVKALDCKVIRHWAEENYSMDVIGLRYQEYFERLLTLWGKGWYDVKEPRLEEAA